MFAMSCQMSSGSEVKDFLMTELVSRSFIEAQVVH
jgi:hypothetical protein